MYMHIEVRGRGGIVIPLTLIPIKEGSPWGLVLLEVGAETVTEEDRTMWLKDWTQQPQWKTPTKYNPFGGSLPPSAPNPQYPLMNKDILPRQTPNYSYPTPYTQDIGTHTYPHRNIWAWAPWALGPSTGTQACDRQPLGPLPSPCVLSSGAFCEVPPMSKHVFLK